mgnify:FL=1
MASEAYPLQPCPLERIRAASWGGYERSEQAHWPSLQGPHNLENAAAAIEACDILGLSGEQIRAGLESYRGLPHRMERIAEISGVAYVNDSKGTNTAASAPAL